MPTLARSKVLASALVALMLSGVLPAPALAVEAGFVTDMTWYTSPAEQDRTAAGVKDVGSKWVRLSVNWDDAEPVQGTYNDWWLTEYEAAVKRARDAGQRVLVMIYGTPKWASASGAKYAPPRNPAEYAGFTRMLVKRLAPLGVEAYEIWNEPNYERFWTTGPNAAEYTRLLKAAYPAVKDADPQAKVVFGGPSLNDWRFLEAAYAAGAKGSFDVLGTHPYSCSVAPERISRETNGRMRKDSFLAYREMRASMRAQNDEKPIWFTEFGWSTASNGCGVSADAQAANLTKALQLANRDSYVEVALAYGYRNNFWEHDGDAVEAQFGLHRTDFTPKPALKAFKDFASGATAGQVPAIIDSQGGALAGQAGGNPASSPSSVIPAGSPASAAGAGGPGTATKRVRLRVTAQGQRSLLASGRVTGAASGTVALTAFYAPGDGGRLKRVSSRTALVRKGTFAVKLSKFRRGRWQVKAALRGTPSAIAANRLRLEDEGKNGVPNGDLPPGVTDDGSRALEDGDATVPTEVAGADARFAEVEAPGPLAGGGYVMAGATDRDAVRSVEKRLRAAGQTVRADGRFDGSTQAAVRSFQRSHGLVVDGIVGRQTAAALSQYR